MAHPMNIMPSIPASSKSKETAVITHSMLRLAVDEERMESIKTKEDEVQIPFDSIPFAKVPSLTLSFKS